MDVVVCPIKLVVSIAKLCIDNLNSSNQLHSENKRICNRIRFFLAEVPIWSEYMSARMDGSGTSVYDSSRLSGLNILMENVHDTLKDIASSVQALNSDRASWNQKLKRRFAPGDIVAKLLDDERRFNTALDDLSRYAATHHLLKIVHANIQETDVSDNIQLAFDDCYDSDEDETEDTVGTSTCSSSEVGKSLSTTGSIHSTVFRKIACQIDFDLLHLTHNPVDRLGIGGFGEVFKGTYAGEFVAIKVIDIYRNYQKISDMPVAEFQMECARVCQETCILKHVGIHPNIVYVLGCYTPPTISIRPVIVMELLDTALDQLLYSNYVPEMILTYIKRLQLLQGIISAVEFLHLQGIVHQDIKPSNILINVDTFVAKLTDFGVADTKKELGTTTGYYCSTKQFLTKAQHTGTRVAQAGTHAYMSPEKICNYMYQASRKSDIYSLGVTLWEVTSKQKPPTPKSSSEMKQMLDSMRNDTSSSKEVLLPFPIPDTNTLDDTVSSTSNVTMEEKCAFSVLEIIAFACLLWDPTCRPNATQLTSYTNNSCLVLHSSSLKLPVVEPSDRIAPNLLYHKEVGVVYNLNLPVEIASFNINDKTVKKKNQSEDTCKKSDVTVSTQEVKIAVIHHSQQQDINCQNKQLNNDIKLLNSVETINISNDKTRRYLIVIVVSVLLIVTVTAVSIMAVRRVFDPPLPPPAVQPLSMPLQTIQPMSVPPPTIQPMSEQPPTLQPTVEPTSIQPTLSPVQVVECFSSNEELYKSVRDYFTSLRSDVQQKYGNMSDWCFDNGVTSFENLFYDNSAARSENIFNNFDEDISQWKTGYITKMTRMFKWAPSFNSDISQWDTSNVRDMERMFRGASSFNNNISQWDTSNVENMSFMFNGATSFNQSLSEWNTSSVLNVESMFSIASSFNSDISQWNTSGVTNMRSMFYEASQFKHAISQWDTSNVQDMSFMFYGATSFNQSLSEWNSSSVLNMEYMFKAASSFNNDISQWNTSGVTKMGGMFEQASSFNNDISQWDTSNVQDMAYMFDDATSFNQSLYGWNTSSVRSMHKMFHGASQFNEDISQWDTSNVQDMQHMFWNATSFNQRLSIWDTSSVLNMERMFRGASSFNSDISQWNTSGVTIMMEMFYLASQFNQDISEWDTSNVQDMSFMFWYATSFNQSLSEWKTSSVLNMESMFEGASSFNDDLSQWDTSGVTNLTLDVLQHMTI